MAECAYLEVWGLLVRSQTLIVVMPTWCAELQVRRCQAGRGSSLQSLQYRATLQVHDIQFDYYGRRIATCSSDKSIRV